MTTFLAFRHGTNISDVNAPHYRRRHGAVAVPVEPKVFDLLAYLIENRERVASKDDLIAAIWGGRIVSESALTSRINGAQSAILARSSV